MKLVDVALRWVGKDFHPGQTEQCMAFVRECLREANHPLATKVTNQPVDKLATSAYYASSLAGRDLGNIVTQIAQLKPGSIVFFEDTYEGDWPPHTITHVGIYVGNEYFVHRPTVARPVEKTNIHSYFGGAHWRCGLIVQEEVAPTPLPPAPKQPIKLKVFSNPNGYRLLSNQDIVLKAGVPVDIQFSTQEFTLQ